MTGRMTWTEAVVGPLAGTTCLWQDLDGVHLEAAPEHAPPTSILWAWDDRRSIRVRLDRDTAFVAVYPADDHHATTLLPWSPDDGRIQQLTPADPKAATLLQTQAWSQIVVDGLDQAVGPITFLRPALERGNPSGP